MITPREALRILAAAAIHDERKPSDVMADGWAEALNTADPDIQFHDCLAAVNAWYIDNPDGRIKPGHVAHYATEIKYARLGAERQEADRQRHALPEQPPDPTVRDRSAELTQLIANGVRLIDPDTGAVRPLRDDPEALHQLQDLYATRPDGSRKWPLVGDTGMRSRQPAHVQATARSRDDNASRAKARRIVAEHRRDSGQPLRPEDVEALAQPGPTG